MIKNIEHGKFLESSLIYRFFKLFCAQQSIFRHGTDDEEENTAI